MMMKYDNSFIIGISQKGLDNGFVLPVKVNFSSVPHLICVAPSGSGKTYALTYFLKQIALKPVQLILADFKSIDLAGTIDRNTLLYEKIDLSTSCVAQHHLQHLYNQATFLIFFE